MRTLDGEAPEAVTPPSPLWFSIGQELMDPKSETRNRLLKLSGVAHMPIAGVVVVVGVDYISSRISSTFGG